MEEKAIVTPNESGTTTNEVVETKTEETGSIDRGVESVSETTEDVDVDFEDNETADTIEDKDASKKQTREQNRLYAQRRRESQRQKILQEEYNRGRREAIKTNPYTNEEITNDEDLANYDLMKEMDNAGYDPTSTSDFIKYQKEKAKKVEQERLAKEQQDKASEIALNKRRDTEVSDFSNKYPNVDINKLVESDKDMFDTMSAYIQSGRTLIESYELYNRLTNKNVVKEANEIAKKQVQVASAKSPSMQDGESVDDTPSWKNLDPQSKEFREYVNKITSRL